MRQTLAVVVALASMVVGCCGIPGFTRPQEPPGVARRPTDPPDAGSVIVFDVALVERTRGDAFLNHELWSLGNEQGVDLEAKPLLEENGLRVAQIGGLLPARLQALLTSPRSCPDPRRLRGDPDQPTPVPVSKTRTPKLAFQVTRDGEPRKVALENAQCYFEVTPTVEGDRRVRLKFVPRVRHGQSQLNRRVARDADGALQWEVDASDPVEDVPEVSWEVVVGPTEYVLVGPRLDRPGTLGAAYFLDTASKQNAQKLLVIRASQLADQAIDEAFHQAPPLALQASWASRDRSR